MVFTGIITDVGEVTVINNNEFSILSNYDPDTIDIGASIACAGCCLTVTDISKAGKKAKFGVDVSNETRSKTTLDRWRTGTNVNLERPLTAGDEFGGHVVTGHVDGVARISDIYEDGNCRRFIFEAPEYLAMYIAPKGSIALDGTSLTVNEVAGQSFGVNLIPHSLDITTWGDRQVGDDVNIEIDLFARYVARLLEYRR